MILDRFGAPLKTPRLVPPPPATPDSPPTPGGMAVQPLPANWTAEQEAHRLAIVIQAANEALNAQLQAGAINLAHLHQLDDDAIRSQVQHLPPPITRQALALAVHFLHTLVQAARIELRDGRPILVLKPPTPGASTTEPSTASQAPK